MSKTAAPASLSFHTTEPTSITRPTNVARSLFHVCAGLVSLGVIRLAPSRGWLFAAAAAFAVFAWTCEVLRRRSPEVNARLMRFFGPVAHAHERHRTNSSTWYVTALALMAAFAPMRAAELGVLVLGFADPAAGVIGRKFGRTRLSANRSLEGSLAFVVAAFAVSFAWLRITGVDASSAFWLSIVAAFVGAIAEVLSSARLDDNFAIPVSVAGSVGIALAFIGA